MSTVVAFAPPASYRFTIEDYLKMGRAGIFAPDERVELIEGQVVPMSPIGNRHVASVIGLSELLGRQVPESIRVVVQNAVNIGGHNQVQPDIALVKLPEDLWKSGISGTDCRLVIEVAETSLTEDRGRKLELYARAGIPEYWVVDLAGRRVEVHRDPKDGAFQTCSLHGRDAAVSAGTVPGVSVPVSEVVPPLDEG